MLVHLAGPGSCRTQRPDPGSHPGKAPSRFVKVRKGEPPASNRPFWITDPEEGRGWVAFGHFDKKEPVKDCRVDRAIPQNPSKSTNSFKIGWVSVPGGTLRAQRGHW